MSTMDRAGMLLAAFTEWCEITCNEPTSAEAATARELVGSLSPESAAATLFAAADLWLSEPRLPVALRIGEIGLLRIVATAVREKFLCDKMPDAAQFLDRLVWLTGSQGDAVLHALRIVRAELEHSDPALLAYAPVDNPATLDLEEAEQWCSNTAPGYDCAWIEDEGWIVYRSGDL